MRIPAPCNIIFTAYPGNLKDLIEKREDGTIPHSLSNVLRLWRPIVIMDEAHNARTPLSFQYPGPL